MCNSNKGQTSVNDSTASAINQFSIGIAIALVIPLLAFYYFSIIKHSVSQWELLAGAVVIVLAITGYLILRKHPAQITKLRRKIESTMHHVAPSSASTALSVEDDIKALEKCMDIMIDELKNKVISAKESENILEEKLCLAKKMESLDIMVSRITHDFNNVIAVILGNAGIVIRNIPSDSANIEHLQQIEKTALQTVEVIKQMHAYSGKDRYSSENIDLSAFTKKYDSEWTSVANNIPIQYELTEKLPGIKAGAEMLLLAMKNLITNAAEVSTNPSSKITIRTGTMNCTRQYLDTTYFDQRAAEGNYAYIQISDNGSGITPEIQARMFDPFFSTKTKKGGLGLCSVMGVVRAASGAIKIQSSPQHGTTITLLFPAIT